MLKSTRTAKVSFIFTTVLIDCIGIGLLIPVFPDIIRRFTHNPTEVQLYFGYFISVYALMQFLASPILGSLSDRFGRRPVLLVSLLGAAIDYLFMALAPTFGWLFLGRIISGLTGASITVASAYMADLANATSDEHSHSTNFGMIGAAFGLGFILGPVLGGIFGARDPRLPFYIAMILNFANFLFGLLVLPESLPKSKRRKISLAGLNPFSSLVKLFRAKAILAPVLVYTLINIAGQVHPSTWTLYTEHKFGWTPFEVGMSLAFVGLMIAITQGWLTRIAVPRLGEVRAIRWGLCFEVFGLLCFAFVTKGWMFFPAMVIYSLYGIAPPAMQALISKTVHPDEQGELQGSLVSIGSVTSIIGPLLFTWLFATFTAPNAPIQFSGAPYFAAALIGSGALFLAFAKIKKNRH